MAIVITVIAVYEGCPRITWMFDWVQQLKISIRNN